MGKLAATGCPLEPEGAIQRQFGAGGWLANHITMLRWSSPRPWRVLISLVLAMLMLTALVSASEGVATWYGEQYHGRRMANGQIFDMYDSTTAASREFSLGTWLHVTSLANGRSVDVQVRDSGAFGHAMDLSYAAFSQLASPSVGSIRVRYEVIPGPGQSAAPAPTAAPARAAASSTSAAPAAVQPNPGRYTVAPGDTLASVARRYGLNVSDIVAWNGISDPDSVREGTVLILTPPSSSAPSSASSPSTTTTGELYVVQTGDTLWQIADRFDIDPDDLARMNGLGPDEIIRVGQTLRVSTADWYTVEGGDTLSSIADRRGTTVEALLRLNDLDSADRISVGQRLRVR